MGSSQQEGQGSPPKTHDKTSRIGLQVQRVGRSFCVDHRGSGRRSPRLQPVVTSTRLSHGSVGGLASLRGRQGQGFGRLSELPGPAEEGRMAVRGPGPSQPALGWEVATWACSAARARASCAPAPGCHSSKNGLDTGK